MRKVKKKSIFHSVISKPNCTLVVAQFDEFKFLVSRDKSLIMFKLNNQRKRKTAGKSKKCCEIYVKSQNLEFGLRMAGKKRNLLSKLEVDCDFGDLYSFACWKSFQKLNLNFKSEIQTSVFPTILRLRYSFCRVCVETVHLWSVLYF